MQVHVIAVLDIMDAMMSASYAWLESEVGEVARGVDNTPDTEIVPKPSIDVRNICKTPEQKRSPAPTTTTCGLENLMALSVNTDRFGTETFTGTKLQWPDKWHQSGLRRPAAEGSDISETFTKSEATARVWNAKTRLVSSDKWRHWYRREFRL
ncbi:putative nicotinamide riboside kinase 2-like [Scophthalmus maximus]|uniref:Putative nicotinamide riboside kinase 2-like n=1 Tax=Scophthalmus maximus TaxID=52904 RepID=A0A2U9C3A7_SCOMX|nr:putative nicotinamide riboside kinase 2-like [Scophthalmus maximus]